MKESLESKIIGKAREVGRSGYQLSTPIGEVFQGIFKNGPNRFDVHIREIPSGEYCLVVRKTRIQNEVIYHHVLFFFDKSGEATLLANSQSQDGKPTLTLGKIHLEEFLRSFNKSEVDEEATRNAYEELLGS